MHGRPRTYVGALADVGALARLTRGPGSGSTYSEHRLHGGRCEVVCEALGVDAELLRGGAFPVVGAKHGADVVQVGCGAVAGVDNRAVGASAQAESEGVGGRHALS